tara:strand:+ start:6145 stop:6675 length:531 start_codon:yes stop_codon:yes gene_type:complete
MKKYTNLILLSLLVVLFYKTPDFLVDSVSTSMGKLMWIIVIVISYQMVDPVNAIILAIIMITLLHQSTVEGFEKEKMETIKTDEDELREMEEKENEKEKENKKKEALTILNKNGQDKMDCDRTNSNTTDCIETFEGFTELLKKLKIPVTNTNTTDLDRDLKTSAERSTIQSSKEQC